MKNINPAYQYLLTERLKFNWMKAYEATLYMLNHSKGDIDWSTAEHLFSLGEHPVTAAKNMMSSASSTVPMKVAILSKAQEKGMTSEDFKNL